MNAIKLGSFRYFSKSAVLRKVAAPKGKTIVKETTVELPVESDPEKLANYVCGTNLFEEGEDVKLKPDTEYPDWLWKIRSPPPLEELDPNTKTYWNRIKSIRVKENVKLLKLQKHKTLQK